MAAIEIGDDNSVTIRNLSSVNYETDNFSCVVADITTINCTAREIKNPFGGLSGITSPGLVRSQFRQEISQVARSTSTITGTRFLNRGYFGRKPLVFGQKS